MDCRLKMVYMLFNSHVRCMNIHIFESCLVLSSACATISYRKFSWEADGKR